MGFLFFDAKKAKNPDLTLETFSSEEAVEISDAALAEEPEMNALLDQQAKVASLDHLDQASSLKEQMLLLEQQVEENPTFELKKLLLDAYLLSQRYPQASQLFFSFSPAEKSQISPQLPFLIAFNSFSQTDPQDYQQLLQTFQQAKES